MCLMSLKGNFQWCDTFMYQNITQLKELQLLKKKKKKMIFVYCSGKKPTCLEIPKK